MTLKLISAWMWALLVVTLLFILTGCLDRPPRCSTLLLINSTMTCNETK